jgi:hypothetical protein
MRSHHIPFSVERHTKTRSFQREASYGLLGHASGHHNLAAALIHEVSDLDFWTLID